MGNRKGGKQTMNRRRFLKTGLSATAGAALVGAVTHPMWASANPSIPSNDEIFSWVEDIYNFGKVDRYGYRMPGTKSDHQNAEYILKKFQQFGLKDTKKESVPAAVAFPDKWTLTVRSEGKNDEEIPCYFMRYVKFTDAAGLSAPMVYVRTGSDEDYAKVDVKGKIVVADATSDGMRVPNVRPAITKFTWPKSYFTYDPDNTLYNDKNDENWPTTVGRCYTDAARKGAAGFVGILEVMAGDMNEYLHGGYHQYELPAVTISPRAGSRLRELLRNSNVTGKITLTGFQGQGETFSLYGFVPGKNPDEIIVIQSHHDGWATNEASGASVVLGLAKYFGQLPPKSMNRTLMFYLIGSHFGQRVDWDGKALNWTRNLTIEQTTDIYKMKPGWDQFRAMAFDLLPKTVCANNIEMIGRQYKRKGDDFVSTGLVSPHMWGVTGPGAEEPNPALLSLTRDAIQKHKLDRSTVYPFFVGEGPRYVAAGVPLVNHLSINAWQFTHKDTLDTVMKEHLSPMVGAFVDIIKGQDSVQADMLKPVTS